MISPATQWSRQTQMHYASGAASAAGAGAASGAAASGGAASSSGGAGASSAAGASVAAASAVCVSAEADAEHPPAPQPELLQPVEPQDEVPHELPHDGAHEGSQLPQAGAQELVQLDAHEETQVGAGAQLEVHEETQGWLQLTTGVLQQLTGA